MDYLILKSFIPEIFFSFSLMLLIVSNTQILGDLKYNFPILEKEIVIQSVFILVITLILFKGLKIEGFLGNYVLINNAGIILLKSLSIFFVICTSLFTFVGNKIQKICFSEFYYVFYLAVLSLLLMISTTDLLLFYLTMELQTLCFYILASINRNSLFSIEAGLKYFISGSFMSGIYLLGCSLVYGSFGTLNFTEIALLSSISLNEYNPLLNSVALIGEVLIIVVLLFKLSCAPFHFWAPDVYEGASISSTVVFSVIPKFGLFIFFARFLSSLGTLSETVLPILMLFGLLSVFVGTFYAFSQKRLKRLIAYSSIAQTGFLLCGLSLVTVEGYNSILFFLVLYLITSILIWGHFILFYEFSEKSHYNSNKNIEPLYLSTMTNFTNYNSLWGLSFVIIFFSIAGIPPLSGFLAKVFIVASLVNYNHIFSASLLIIISAISVYYYIRIIKVMFFEPFKNSQSDEYKVIYLNEVFYLCFFMFCCGLFALLLLFYYPNYLYILCQHFTVGSLNF